MTETVQILSGGAAQGLVEGLQQQFSERGLRVAGTFGAVGAMRDRLLGGDPCDLLILTQALIAELEQQGHVRPGTAQPLGRVRTGIAVKAGVPLPGVADAASLKQLLEKAGGVYFPDPQKATAGIHFMKVLRSLGLDGQLKDRMRTFPNGATAMKALAAAPEAGAVGCTQVTEILYTPGVQLAGGLPPEFELATVYTAAVCTRARSPEAAAAVAALLASPASAGLRRSGGFDPL
ncbi:molybdate ABC transporter substrate-binding protein [Ramlibacter sp. Leaf400]|uniref:molybdate ABC transporter substrate-binding protein n=1 Tax=Ramlibacter sp. Leaf400 TaxID=1736365 RepID=UPI0006F9A1F2|nr:substrate-binding domain-containing protein [Ramlibacter sp. Leaf400]KQT14100.1 molybdate ABC transporter substrate-binding protein [Ramlibacter sp. Leaf400]